MWTYGVFLSENKSSTSFKTPGYVYSDGQLFEENLKCCLSERDSFLEFQGMIPKQIQQQPFNSYPLPYMTGGGGVHFFSLMFLPSCLKNPNQPFLTGFLKHIPHLIILAFCLTVCFREK